MAVAGKGGECGLSRSTAEIKVKLLPGIENDGETAKLMRVNTAGIIINPIHLPSAAPEGGNGAATTYIYIYRLSLGFSFSRLY